MSPSLEISDTTALVRAARSGDREAFGELYRQYGAMVHGICLARVPPQEARDLVQDVFIHALRRLGQLREDAAFGGWLAALARHATADFHRRPDRRAPAQELPDDLAAAERADGGAGYVLAAIRGLPEAYRETLMLRLVRRHERAGDRPAHRTPGRFGARQPAPRDEAPAANPGRIETVSADRPRPEPPDYLWDPSAPPDPEIARLETLLASARHRGEPPKWPQDQVRPAPWTESRRPPFGSGSTRRLLLAAGFAALAIGVLAFWRLAGSSRGWTLASYDGAPAIDGGAASPGRQLAPGQWLTTDASSRARLLLPRVGEVEIGPGSRLRVLADRRDAQALALERGSLLARTWAPPKLFSIETPVGRAVDYGCAYALDVDRAGTTHLRVEMGWVALEIDGHEALVPSGASLRAGLGEPIGSPVWLDAPRAFRAAVERLDRAAPGADERGAALDAVLSGARPRDTLTLWHLLANAPEGERPALYERLAQLAPPPPGVGREAVLAGDRAALREWFASLGLGEVPGWE